MLFLDTETCGLVGPAIIIQYTRNDDKEITIFNFWKEQIIDSLKLIEEICNEDCVVGFNLAFDWFQLVKLHCMFSRFVKLGGSPLAYPEDHTEELANLEKDSRDGDCLKPKAAIDLMLVARKTKYQITMNRGDIHIRKVPTVLAQHLANHLEKEIVLSGILFARRKDKYAPKWRVVDRKKNISGKDIIDPDFKDVELKFKPSVALKALAIDALNINNNDILTFKDIEIDKYWNPNEIPYAPFAEAVRDCPMNIIGRGTKLYKKIYRHRQSKWKWAWPDVIEKHIAHWYHNEQAKLYASKDVDYTRQLYHYFGCPSSNDDDSILACMVGAVRWKGYSIDIPGLNKLKAEAYAKIESVPRAPKQVKRYLFEYLSESEQKILSSGGTKKVVLEELAKWKNKKCPLCVEVFNEVDKDCSCCHGSGLYSHIVADKAQEILDARKAKKEIELYDKLLLAGRFHASFKVIGTLSSRMSGSDGLNAQGVDHSTRVRSKFTFSQDNITILVGGDFDGFEVVLADAAYNDPGLRNALTSGKKIHGLFGMELKPGVTYEEVLASKGTKEDLYDMGKRGVFSQIYGGNENTLVNKLGVSLEVATRASKGFLKRFPKMAEERKKIFDMFCSMRQPNGLGTKVEWHEPQDYVESLFGFRRYFILENMICKSLFNLACKPPKEWTKLAGKIKVIRRDRVQTGNGALASALYAAAFSLQAANMRAAANHVIQSSGAQITKSVQRKIWDLQPSGIHKWMVEPCNIHDEILCVIDPSIENAVKETVSTSVDNFKDKVPLIKMIWKRMETWASK